MRTNKIKCIALIIVFLSIVSLTNGQEWLYFTGKITEKGTNEVLQQQPVFITEMDSVPLSFSMTNIDGIYFDSVYYDTAGFGEGIVVSTPDCYGIMQSAVFQTPDSLNIANFQVCSIYDSCQAYFTYQSELYDPFLFHFTDLSVGQADHWYWEFGDGNYSIEENPSHQFNSPGSFEVCLTITDSLENCLSQYCEYVYVNDSGCVAVFNWTADSANPFKIFFEDQSIGNIDFWSWDFGDVTFSEDQSPVHIFAEPGEYMVTLEVFEMDSSCYSFVQELITVGEAIDCEANFTIALDTLNNTPFVYQFADISSGVYNQISWDFGDGITSDELNPTHIYSQGGTYQVCLEIYSTDSTYSCYDYHCATITTPEYFNFGGHVFLGDYPLNVEEYDSSNIAVASLYRRLNNQWKLMDTREFWKFGYYWFVDKPEGEYIIRTDLLPQSEAFELYSPTYSSDVRFWENAQTFYLFDGDSFSLDMHLQEMAQYNSGVGFVSGKLTPGLTCDFETNVSNELIYLLDDNNQIIKFCYTDEEGYFEFDGLGNGIYELHPEITGKLSERFLVILDNQTTNHTDIEMVVNCNAFVDINEPVQNDELAIKNIYPQPASSLLNVALLLSKNKKLEFALFNSNGTRVFSESRVITKNETLSIDVSIFTSGLYLLKVTDLTGKQMAVKRIIIN